jgi:pimeloyl-ACP methyl ester carboxylesterase
MGGFIAQSVAVRYPERVRTLTLIMTSTGSRLVGLPKLRVLPRLLRGRAIADRADAGSAVIETFRLIGSHGYALDEEYLRDIATRSWDRGFEPVGHFRQLAASSAQSNRTRALRRLSIPTLVLHGLDDPLVRPSGGLALARAVPRAKYVGFAGMGHDLPRPLWPDIAREIAELTSTAAYQASPSSSMI